MGLDPVAALLVRGVEDDGPAARASIRAGDVLLRAGRRELRSVASLYAATEDVATTGRLRLELLRGSERHRVTVRLGDAGDTAARGPAGAAEHRL